MRVNEVMVVEATPARFKKQSKIAMFNGKPADPKKVMMAFKNSLNYATEMNFRMTPVDISEKGYISQYRYNEWQDESDRGGGWDGGGRKELLITVKVSWRRDGSRGKPVTEVNIFNSHDEMNLFNYRIELDDETVSNMWSPMTVKTIHEYIEEEENYYTDDDEDDDPEPDDWDEDENREERGGWVNGQWDPNLIIETSARFKAGSNTAMLDGRPANPKKILGLMQKSLNKTTGFNWKMTPTKMLPNKYAGDFTFEDTTITVEVSWDSDYGARVYSIDSPAVTAVNDAAFERNIFFYAIQMNTKNIGQIWKKSADDIRDRINGRRAAQDRFDQDARRIPIE